MKTFNTILRLCLTFQTLCALLVIQQGSLTILNRREIVINCTQTDNAL